MDLFILILHIAVVIYATLKYFGWLWLKSTFDVKVPRLSMLLCYNS
jgi:hypothetical protein